MPQGPTSKAYAIRLTVGGRPLDDFANKIAPYEDQIGQVIQGAVAGAAGVAATIGALPAAVALSALGALGPIVIHGII